MDQVQLKSSDGELFTVESYILAGSAVLQNRLEKLQTPKIENAILVVPEANANLLKLVLEWLRNHKAQDPARDTPERTDQNGDKEISNNQEASERNNQQDNGIGDWEQEFFTSNLQSILLVMAVAKRLNISTLLTVAGRFVFFWIRSNSLQKFFETAGMGIASKETPAPAGNDKSNESNESNELNEINETEQSDSSAVNETPAEEEGSNDQIVEATEPSPDVIPDAIPAEVPEVIVEEVPEVIPETAPVIAEETVIVLDE